MGLDCDAPGGPIDQSRCIIFLVSFGNWISLKNMKLEALAASSRTGFTQLYRDTASLIFDLLGWKSDRENEALILNRVAIHSIKWIDR